MDSIISNGINFFSLSDTDKTAINKFGANSYQTKTVANADIGDSAHQRA